MNSAEMNVILYLITSDCFTERETQCEEKMP